MRLATLFLIALAAAAAAAGRSASPAQPMPVYVLLAGTIEDHVNLELSEERIDRVLSLVDRHRHRFPQDPISCLLQFTGLTSDALAVRSTNGLLDRLRAEARKGVVEIGYDGSEEPTFVARPRPNLRAAATPDARWVARLEPTAWFLREHKDIITGEPDPARSGGLQRTREVFGHIASVAGVSLDLGGDSELVHELRRDGLDPLLPGFTDAAVFPARTINGYQGGIAVLSRALSPLPDTAPEVFWQDGALRLSEYIGANTRVAGTALDGPDGVRKLVEGLDRTRVHVVRVRIGDHRIYTKTPFGARNYTTPLEYAYDNPKGYRLPPDAVRSREQIDEAYAREEAAIDWLSREFFAANPGSRFVSVSDLRRMAARDAGAVVSQEAIVEAAAHLLAEWKTLGASPPGFVRSGDEHFSLAELFLVLAGALAERHRTGVLPFSVTLTPIYGPLETNDEQGPADLVVTAGAIDRACAPLIERLRDTGWKPVPANSVPGLVTIDGGRVNAAQFLRLMATALPAASPDSPVKVESASMFSTLGTVFPRTRSRLEMGATWTLKPARLTTPSESTSQTRR
jgi:hypothetical protein